MNRLRFFILAMTALLAACSTVDEQGTIAQLRNRHIEIREERLDGGLEKAMESYRRFLTETPDSPLAPEAIRRLADLKVEKEYGLIGGDEEQSPSPVSSSLDRPPASVLPAREGEAALTSVPAKGETEADFETRATRTPETAAADSEGLSAEASAKEGGSIPGADGLERAGALEAIELYKKLLADYPQYGRNDQVLYQMSRAYEELGRVEEAMDVMNQLVRDFPASGYLDEVQFRRAEYFFTRRKYLDAEDAYKSIVGLGAGSAFFELALYKLGWTFYKQELYEEALDEFIALLDAKVSAGYNFDQTADEPEHKRMDDTFRVVSLSFSNLGGADSVVEYFSRHGGRTYEDGVYSNLAEHYVEKRRYSDAVKAYEAFVSRNPFHRKAPNFHMRIIEINIAGGFPTLVIDSKKAFASTYALKAEYWRHFDPKDRPEVLGYLKTNLTDLANHYHALYREPKHTEEKGANFAEALHWYREFLLSFPADAESPGINYQMADLLLENGAFGEAAVEYERTAYDYPRHEKSSTAGYAAVYAYRQQLAASQVEKDGVKREVIRSSLKFAETFPAHDKASVVLGAAADDLYDMGEHEQALAAAQKLISAFPGADANVLRSAWLVVAHSSYELHRYSEAEAGYVKVLELIPEGDKARDGLVDNLAASIYKQGEEANASGDFRAAADHFLRVGRMAPTSKIRPNAEFDAAAALIALKNWTEAAVVLTAFRSAFPGHELQPEVTKKIAYVYREDGKLDLAASEYERIEQESQDEEVRREALLMAAQLYETTDNSERALVVYRRYVDSFPQPVELNLETRSKIADILKGREDRGAYLDELRQIVDIEAAAVDARTPRTRYLAASAALVLAEGSYERFAEVRLVKPFEVNLRRKQELMKAATQEFNKLLDYEVGEVTAAATFYLGEIYAGFSKALTESERPDDLSPLEMEQYELAIEEQVYPFEEKAIAVHESNLELIPRGIYNEWIERSLHKLAKFVPARYDKPEEATGIISSLESYTFAVERPAAPVSEEEAAAPSEVAEAPVEKPAEVEQHAEAAEPAEVATEPAEVATEPAEVATKPAEVATEPAEVATKPAEVATKPVEVATKPVEVATEPARVAEPVEGEPTEVSEQSKVAEPVEAADVAPPETSGGTDQDDPTDRIDDSTVGKEGDAGHG